LHLESRRGRVAVAPALRFVLFDRVEVPMIGLKNILVATDFSEPSAVALDYGRHLARSYDATLHVLHVIENDP
jgi:hypothetical protein